jgi:TnpA family transposase
VSRRKLLTEDERAHLFGIPIDEAGLARHYTLSPDDLELLHAKRGARNILGAAVQLALLRHPGFGLRSDELVSDALLRYLAEQLGVPVSAFRHYATRAQTRQNHAQELAGRLGLRLSRRGDLPSRCSTS